MKKTLAGIMLAAAAVLGAGPALAAPEIDIPLLQEIDTGAGESSYEVTADWGAGEVVTDVSTGAEQPGESDPIEPEHKPEAGPEKTETAPEPSEDESESAQPETEQSAEE